jgi:hypothetical protein
MIKIKTQSVLCALKFQDGITMIFILKSNANLVINITCVLLHLSRAIYIFECINLSVQDLILGELFQAMIILAWD